jgi:hypothetical protein
MFYIESIASRSFFGDVCDVCIQGGRNIDEHNVAKTHTTLKGALWYLFAIELVSFQTSFKAKPKG